MNRPPLPLAMTSVTQGSLQAALVLPRTRHSPHFKIQSLTTISGTQSRKGALSSELLVHDLIHVLILFAFVSTPGPKLSLNLYGQELSPSSTVL